MSEISLPTLTIRYEGPFNYQGLIDMLYNWFAQRGWEIHEGKAVNTGDERELKWTAGIDVTEYIHYDFTLNFLFKDFGEQQGADGSTVQKSRFYVEIESKLTTDWQGKFGGSKFKEKLGKWYESWVYDTELNNIYTDKLEKLSWQLYDDIKAFLNMESKLS